MKAYLPFIVLGLFVGAVYALAAMGLVLTYTTSGVFNFAHGAVGMFATYTFYSMRQHGVPTALALALAVLCVGPAMGAAIDRLLLRRLAGAPAATTVVVTLGLLVGLQGLAVAIYGGARRRLAPLFPTSTFHIPGVNIGYDQVIVFGISVAAGIALFWVLNHTHAGLQTRAVVGDPELSRLVGTNASSVTTGAWMAGAAFATLSGILFAPLTGLDSVILTLLVVQAFGAAIVGRLRNLPLAIAGAYGIGIAEELSAKLVTHYRSLAGLPTSLPFIVLFIVLVASPKGSFVEVNQEGDEAAASAGSRIPTRFPIIFGPIALGVALLVPFVASSARLATATTAVTFVLIFASLSLLVGLSRQVSLCHAVFVVFGATNLYHFTHAGIPYLPALLLSALVLVPVGALVAIPAIRLSGVFLALATFGFGVLAQYLLFNTEFAFGANAVVSVPRPGGFGSDTRFYYFTLIVVAALVVVIEVLRVTRLGRILRCVGDSPTALRSVGIKPLSTQVLVFCLTAFFAAVAGGLLGSQVGTLNTTSFDFFQSLVWLTVLVAAGVATLGGSVLASVLLIVVPALFTSPEVTKWQPVAFGVLAIAFAQAPNGIVGIFRIPNFAKLSDGASLRRRDHARHRERQSVRSARHVAA
jgi:branched-subunit amino acid ABC-type transport system permease component